MFKILNMKTVIILTISILNVRLTLDKGLTRATSNDLAFLVLFFEELEGINYLREHDYILIMTNF